MTFQPFLWNVTQAQICAYARAAGADDPIHVGQSGSGEAGGTIAQGMLVLAVMAEYVASSLPDGGPWRARGGLDIRFRQPVRPGDRLTMCATPAEPGGDTVGDGFATYDLTCKSDSGVVVIAGTVRIPRDAFMT